MSKHDPDEREIVKLLRSASALAPTEAEHAAAVARVRESVIADAPGSPPRRNHRRRILGAAAAVGGLLLAIAMLLLGTRPRTAWAELEAATEASGSFRGWVSLRTDLPGAKPFMMFDTERLSRADMDWHDQTGHRGVRFLDHRRATYSSWSAASNTIYVAELSPAELGTTYEWYARHFNIAVDFREQLKNMREAMGAGNLDVRSERDEPLERFDMKWFLRDAAGHRQATPVDVMSYWVDPATHLIRKVRHARRDSQPSTLVYDYNDPVVNDIHDLGVPRDAKVVDRRPTGRLKELLDALDRRIEAGTGDGVAVITTVVSKQEPSKNGPVLDTLAIYGRSGDRWVWTQYLVGAAAGRDAVGNAGSKPQLAAPPGWPNLEPAAAVALVKDLRPDDIFVHDGHRTFRSFKGSRTLAEGDPPSTQDAAFFGVPGWYWPGRFRLRIYSPWSVPSLRDQEDGTETITVDEFDMAQVHRYASHEVTLSRETGLPTSAIERVFDNDGVERHTARWTFTSNLRTPAGVDLPQRWTYESFSAPGKLDYRKGATLRFDPAARVPESWFEPPERRFAALR